MIGITKNLFNFLIITFAKLYYMIIKNIMQTSETFSFKRLNFNITNKKYDDGKKVIDI